MRSLCQHACRNTKGSYQCLCPTGYRLLPSGKNCQGELRTHGRGQGRALWAAASLTQATLSGPFSTISCEGGTGR